MDNCYDLEMEMFTMYLATINTHIMYACGCAFCPFTYMSTCLCALCVHVCMSVHYVYVHECVPVTTLTANNLDTYISM